MASNGSISNVACTVLLFVIIAMIASDLNCEASRSLLQQPMSTAQCRIISGNTIIYCNGTLTTPAFAGFCNGSLSSSSNGQIYCDGMTVIIPFGDGFLTCQENNISGLFPFTGSCILNVNTDVVNVTASCQIIFIAVGVGSGGCNNVSGTLNGIPIP